MATALTKFINNSIGSHGRTTDYLPIISPSGDFTRIYDINVILASWNTILITPLRSVSYNPDFGSKLYKFIWEPYDDDTMNDIKDEVRLRLSQENRATIQDVSVLYMTNKKGFSVNITASYQGSTGNLGIPMNEANYFNFLSNS